ncbi:MAG TPA: MlaD family protein [Candidatus Competibacteraceae bacterium]|nr:MlaD family protein [Candidatus Competibacteraceae bacterium]
METKLNYTLVGLFVVLLGAALVGVVLWLTVGAQDKQYDLYRVYTSESVSGLNPKAAVKYRGVQVGRVAAVELDKHNPERVEIVLEIERGTPVRTDTRAVLTTQGLTGLTSIELTGGSRESPPLAPQRGEPPPVIASGPSLAARLDEAFNNIVTSIYRLSGRLELLLNDRNLQAIGNTLASAERITATVAQGSDSIGRTLANLEAASADLDRLLAKADRVLDNAARGSNELPLLLVRAREATQALRQMADNIARTSTNLDKVVSQGQRDLREWATGTGPQLSGLMLELGQLAESLRRFTDELDRNPRMLLLGRPSGRPGPGE